MNEEQRARFRRRAVGFVFQSFNLLPTLSVAENLALPLALNGLPGQQRIPQMLARLGLTDRADHHPNQLSGGQQQRVAIARALVTQPSLLLADEPTGNLDSTTSHEVMEIFARLSSDRGLTVVVITHERDIAAYGTRTVDFKDGLIVSDKANDARVPAQVG